MAASLLISFIVLTVILTVAALVLCIVGLALPNTQSPAAPPAPTYQQPAQYQTYRQPIAVGVEEVPPVVPILTVVERKQQDKIAVLIKMKEEGRLSEDEYAKEIKRVKLLVKMEIDGRITEEEFDILL